MINKPKPKAYLLPLLIIFVIISTSVTAFLMKIIVDYGYIQFGRIIKESLGVAIDYSQSTLDTIIERQKLWIKDEVISSEIQEAISNYKNNNVISRELLSDQFIKYQEDQVKLHTGAFTTISYEIINNNKVLYSTEGITGRDYIPVNYDRYNKFISGKSNNKFLISFKGNEDNEYDLIILIPYYRDLDETFISIRISNIDMGRIFKMDRFKVFPGTIYFVNSKKQLFVKYGKSEIFNPVFSDYEVPDSLLELLKSGNHKEIELIPYRNINNERVIGIGSWIDLLDIGILFEIPSRIILGPWYIMGGFIVAVSIISMLIFVIISVFLDKKRIRAYDHNPITHLPGNQIIVEKIEMALKMKDMIIVYCDLDNFKAFNDLYGFSAGDSVISYSAKTLEKHLAKSRKSFLGHIGGDDFVVIGKKDILIPLLEEFGKDFDEGIKKFYSQDDIERGYIISKDRQENEMKFPFIAMSMGGLELIEASNIHPLRVAELCAEVKKIAKKEIGSKLVLDRRRVN